MHSFIGMVVHFFTLIKLASHQQFGGVRKKELVNSQQFPVIPYAFSDTNTHTYICIHAYVFFFGKITKINYT